MALRKHVPCGDAPPGKMKPLTFSFKPNAKIQPTDLRRGETDANVEVDLREIFFLIMHFLSTGPCQRACGELWNELLEHQLLPRRYHAWYSRSGASSGHGDDDGMSLPLNYTKLVERYPHIQKDHLVKLLKQLMLNAATPVQGLHSANGLNAAAVPTFLGTGYFSLLSSEQHKKTNNEVNHPPGHMRWPHMKADQVRGLSLREIGGGFSRYHRSPSIRAASYAIAKPSTMVQKMQNIKRVRGHRYAVYCSIFDRTGRYVITGSDDRLVKIWSMETAYCLTSCRGHEGDITDLAVSFNNVMVASAANDCIIRVWRLYDGMPISVLRGHTGAVTALAFSPRPSSPGHLLSSSDDGTCRLWEARCSQLSPRVYIPKPTDSTAGKSTGPSSSTAVQTHQILCCAFNASGTVFVTGSSDTLARVWIACKLGVGDTDQPNHEMDILAGHENDVNYVQFSGCAVTYRYSTSDAMKDGNIPKFKNTWFNQDNIVTCSRDGSAIIWIPRSRRSHGKVIPRSLSQNSVKDPILSLTGRKWVQGKAGRWTRAYHLKVPPPPMPPQPPRGGPRQRILPTPRGVNMIVWSLDNRFVLAAIMDCRICVWNAADGSLVHSLTGHTESTYVLDVHPFNPRIAMSAGYDGKTIVWDIWEGVPIRIYEIGRYKLVDGKFSPDGTSIILSDDVGQLYILTTGQGESQKDAKYDQFFLGDYRPLVQDTHGNVLDQETQLTPYRRNLQDLLCDSGMIPYPEPYQSAYQKRRLGALGVEWRPSSFKFAVGTDINLVDQEYQMLPIADLDLYIEPFPEFVDAMDWEPELEIQSDDADSEYNVPEEYSSAGEQASLNSGSSDSENSEDGEGENSEQDGRRRSKRKKQKADAEVTTSSGRRVKRRNLDECDSSYTHHRARKSKVRKAPRKRSSSSKSLRPQRAAARNALHLFSRITGTSTDSEEEYSTVGDSSESESVLEDMDGRSDESNVSTQNGQCEDIKGKEILVDKSEDISKLDQHSEYHVNAGGKRRLVIRFPSRGLKKVVTPETTKLNGEHQPSLPDVASTSQYAADVNRGKIHVMQHSASDANGEVGRSNKGSPVKVEQCLDLLEGYKNGNVSWGGVRIRSSKRSRMGDAMPADEHAQSNAVDEHFKTDNCSNSPLEESEAVSSTSKVQNGEGKVDEAVPMDRPSHHTDMPVTPEGTELGNTESCFGVRGDQEPSAEICQNAGGRLRSLVLHSSGEDNDTKVLEKPSIMPTKLRITSKMFSIDQESVNNSKVDSASGKSGQDVCDTMLENGDFRKILDTSIPVSNEAEILDQDKLRHDMLPESGSVDDRTSKSPSLELQQLPSQSRMFTAVYRRSKSSKGRGKQDDVDRNNDAGTSAAHSTDISATPESATERVRRTRSIRLRSSAHDTNVAGTSKVGEVCDDSVKTPSEPSTAPTEEDETSGEGKRSGRTSILGWRSTRNRKGSSCARDLSPPERRKTIQFSRSSWLMLSKHEESSRYIPQLGDEVVYLRQGHQEYIAHRNLRDVGPWGSIKGNIKIVEFCRVEELEYAHHSGSGDSCCKMTLRFTDPTSTVFNKSFRLTLPEVTSFPDFLVERSRYDASLARNWTYRDKCQVWWKNEGDESGSWWEGRIVTVKDKSSEFPDSPWEKYVVQYKSTPTETHQHSPWELYDSDTNWETPHIDDDIREKLLVAFAKLEQSANKKKDYYGVQKLREVSQKPCFINRFPVPLTLELIQCRLENNYYRSLEAMKHDMKVLLSNADTYVGRNAEFKTKLRRLSDWFTRTLSS